MVEHAGSLADPAGMDRKYLTKITVLNKTTLLQIKVSTQSQQIVGWKLLVLYIVVVVLLASTHTDLQPAMNVTFIVTAFVIR